MSQPVQRSDAHPHGTVHGSAQEVDECWECGKTCKCDDAGAGDAGAGAGAGAGGAGDAPEPTAPEPTAPEPTAPEPAPPPGEGRRERKRRARKSLAERVARGERAPPPSWIDVRKEREYDAWVDRIIHEERERALRDNREPRTHLDPETLAALLIQEDDEREAQEYEEEMCRYWKEQESIEAEDPCAFGLCYWSGKCLSPDRKPGSRGCLKGIRSGKALLQERYAHLGLPDG